MPGNWQTQGYGVPLYSNIPYPFQKDPPRVMGEPPRNFTNYAQRNPVGSYRRTFTVPELSGRAGRSSCSSTASTRPSTCGSTASRSATARDSRTPAVFNITPYLRRRRELLAVEVYRYCDGSYLEDQDFWRLSGIFRDVFLWSAADLHVRDFFVHTELDDDYRDATLRRRRGRGTTSPTRTIARRWRLEICSTATGNTVAATASDDPRQRGGEPAQRRIARPCRSMNPAKWTAEDAQPLHSWSSTLKDAGGQDRSKSRSHNVGFRKVEIRDGQLLVNGQPIYHQGRQSPRARPGHRPRRLGRVDDPRHPADEAVQHQRRPHLATIPTTRSGTTCATGTACT